MPESPLAPAEQGQDCVCTQCGTNTGLERIDATKVNELVDALRSRLSRDVHGNFFVEGAKTGKDTRHGQLGDLFSLMSHLENFQGTMDRYIALHGPKEVVEVEKPVTLNKSMRAAMKSMIEEETSERLRSLTIRCERLEEETKAAKSKQLQKAGGTSVKASSKQPLSAEVAKLDSRVTTLAQTQAASREHGQHIAGLGKVTASQATLLRSLQTEVAALSRYDELYTRKHESLEQEVTDLYDRTNGIEADTADDVCELRGAISKLKDWRYSVDKWTGMLDIWKETLDTTIIESPDRWLDQVQRSVDERLREIEKYVDERLRKIERYVSELQRDSNLRQRVNASFG